jgi:hypothetical protein
MRAHTSMTQAVVDGPDSRAAARADPWASQQCVAATPSGVQGGQSLGQKPKEAT